MGSDSKTTIEKTTITENSKSDNLAQAITSTTVILRQSRNCNLSTLHANAKAVEWVTPIQEQKILKDWNCNCKNDEQS